MQRAAGKAAGLTDAQREMAARGLKAMIPFKRPFLDYVISALADAGCTDVCLIVGPGQDAIREHYEHAHPPRRARVSFAVQPAALGTADAILTAAPFTRDEAFLALNADNYYPVEVYRALAALGGQGLPAFSRDALLRDSNIDPERIRSFALLRLSPNGDLQDIVEKPDDDTYSAMAEGDVSVSMNIWRFDERIHEACRRIQPSPRGELELPNAVRFAVRELRQRFRTFPVETGVLDLSRPDDIPEVGRRLAAIDPQP